MKIRLSKSLKNNEIAFSNATERDEISPITMPLLCTAF